MNAAPLRVGVLVSGAGTNLQALIDRLAPEDARIVAVASSRPDARALERAHAAGIETGVFARGEFADRRERDEQLGDWLAAREIGLLVLAGYAELLGPGLLARFPGAIINVHPSLLPEFPGLHAIEQALAAGAERFGVTVHFVDDGMDTGPVILQGAVELPGASDPAVVLAALRPLEHTLLPAAVKLFARGELALDPSDPHRVLIDDEVPYARAIAEPSTTEPRQPTPSPSILARSAPGEVRVRRALLSVSDKSGLLELARGLADLGVELVSTGGTARALTAGGLAVRSIEDFTGFPEIMDGRVKTLHPRLYAGLLAVRDNDSHLVASAEHAIEAVDLVCVNLYPFERTAARADSTDAEVIEDIDIGGPSMIRAAAKNHAYVGVVVSPEDYGPVLDELRMSAGKLSPGTRERLAHAAFAHTARYDAAISAWFATRAGEDFPQQRTVALEKVLDLRYGENPHQRAAYYADRGAPTHLLGGVRQHQGKELSFNNLLDLAAARALVAEFDGPACAIVKHNNPCGVALGEDIDIAYARALAADPVSAFGGIVALNGPVGHALASELASLFLEVVVAPAYDQDALALLAAKPSVRVLEEPQPQPQPPAHGDQAPASAGPSTTAVELKPVLGGMLAQDADAVLEGRDDMTVPTRAKPSEEQWRDLMFAWRVCRHVRSNAIVLAAHGATVGIGGGQTSRVDAVRIAVEKARELRPGDLAGAVLASDAFFPFADGPELAFAAGVRAIIQPGGSVRDAEVIAAADGAGVAMAFTGRRHFRH